MRHHSISTTATTDSNTIMDLSIIDELALFENDTIIGAWLKRI
jgi:hypothetical protein